MELLGDGPLPDTLAAELLHDRHATVLPIDPDASWACDHTTGYRVPDRLARHPPHTERRRLFDLPRSSWADYDPALLSTGGGVHPRTAKAVPISAQVRSRLGLPDEVDTLTPAELIRAILTAPVDLFWNGGIGTYVKASAEGNADIGDKANDAIRVDGAQVRALVVGEGGNLGFSQLGRIEYARLGAGGGGRINTDAIDNSGRRGHLRPRGEHQDPARPDRARR